MCEGLAEVHRRACSEGQGEKEAARAAHSRAGASRVQDAPPDEQAGGCRQPLVFLTEPLFATTTISILFSRFFLCSSHYLESNMCSLPSRIQASLLSSSPLPPPVVLASGPPRLSQPTLAKLLRRRHEFLGRSGKSSGQERLRAPPPGCAYQTVGARGGRLRAKRARRGAGGAARSGPQ